MSEASTATGMRLRFSPARRHRLLGMHDVIIGKQHVLHGVDGTAERERRRAPRVTELPQRGDGRSIEVLVCPDDFAVLDLDHETGRGGLQTRSPSRGA